MKDLNYKLPKFLCDLLDCPPVAGEGVHRWLFSVARHLHLHLPAVEIVALLESRVVNCGRQVPRGEILNAVQNSVMCAWQPFANSSVKAATKWPPVNKEQREAVIRANGGLADLWKLSPVRIEDNRQHTEEILDRLYPGNPLLCCGESNAVFDTRPRNNWRGELSTLQLIVPSPMSAIEGVTKDGKSSRHTLSNTGARRFLIVEFDTGATDEHAALLIHLAGYAPLVCTVHSGGKSLHGWFFVESQPEEKILKFFRYAVSLGGDRATWTRSQFVRLPDGTRDNGNRQTVFFLNFKPLETRK
jgi:hypothetical protein